MFGPSKPLEIVVTAGLGRGPTRLAAFDSALTSAGVADYNLIKLSSIIPAGSKVLRDSSQLAVRKTSAWGDRLYVVIADCRIAEPFCDAWAGLGWWQDDAGRGVFVEHEGGSQQAVEEKIAASLNALFEGRRSQLSLKGSAPQFQQIVVGTTCKDEPVCAVVIAAFTSSEWTDAGS